MILHKKTLTIIGLTLAVLIVILFATSRIILLRTYTELEQKHVRQNIDRALRALSRELASLETIAHDWAAWDDTYVFIADANDHYVKSNLVDETFTDIRLNLMLFIDASGKAVFAKAFDLKNEEQMPVPRTIEEQLSDNSPLLHHTNTDSSLSGIILNPEGAMLIVSEPVVTSEEEGPIRGTLIMARYLDASGIKHLAETTQLSLSMYRLDDPQIPSDVQVARSSLSDQAPIALYPLSAQSIAGYALLKDIYGKSILVLKVDMPREIYQKGEASISFFILSLGVVGLVFGVVIILLLDKQVLSRVTRLGKTVSTIGLSSNLSTRVSITGKDELSELANEVNRMLEALQQSEESLRRAHDDLERRVEERTAELVKANKQLKREIEDRRHAEQALSESEARLQLILETVPSGLFTVDLDRKITYWNKEAEEITGLKAEAAIGKDCLEAFHCEECKIGCGLLDDKVDKPIYEKGCTIRVHGRGITISKHADILKDSQGNTIGGMESFIDVTERKRAEEALFNSHEKLRSLASELSLAEERQRRHVAIEVHDHISQNLAFVKMNLGALRASTSSSSLAGTMDEVLKLVDETIQNTRALISELGSPILYELGFVPAVEWLTQQAQRQHDIVVDFEDDGQPKLLSEDVRVLLFQAARELLVNIAKHAKAPNAKVSITRDGNQIRVDVEDDGVGFESAEIGPSVDTTGRFG